MKPSSRASRIPSRLIMSLPVLLICTALVPLTTASPLFAALEERVVEMEPVVVSEKPLGFLGVTAATIGMNPFKLVTGMKAIRWVRIDALEAGSPGAQGGILPGDFVNAINGRTVSTYSRKELLAIANESELGTETSVEIYRPTTKHTFVVRLIAVRRKNPPAPPLPAPAS